MIIGDMNLIDKDDKLLRDMKYVKPTYESLIAEGMVLTNQAAFWRRRLHKSLGYLDEKLDCGFDFEWFLRLLQGDRIAVHINVTLGGLRLHGDTKTSNRQHVFDAEYQKILAGRNASFLNKKYHQLRRLVLMMHDGNFSYISRGLFRRLRKY
jgi:hypothetical protein